MKDRHRRKLQLFCALKNNCPYGNECEWLENPVYVHEFIFEEIESSSNIFRTRQRCCLDYNKMSLLAVRQFIEDIKLNKEEADALEPH